MKRLTGFLLVGIVGFLIDGGILLCLTEIFHIEVILARLASFPAAMVTTWLLNRTFVFTSNPSVSFAEFFKYFTVQGTGAIINFTVYSVLVTITRLSDYPVIALAIAALLAMIFNYAGANKIVFNRKAPN
ncbi:GtrA family protein [Phyllobacterium chamaecytisi]|uniref:GtrA family protein n=1 Tax=Phyllobacterium chamaecytisi TaxID=2876082 RepID=UPI001CCB5832|nr:GtrA family protein [Phyllobacterium sp. KW56]MBZ9603880.1 GtrA family protein [Phyllobacterium sp. KW56]